MDHNEFNKKLRNKKLTKIIGWCLIVAGIITFTSTLISYFNWNKEKANYTKEYVYSNYGTLYYEKNGTNVFVEKILNTDNEIISLNIPDKKTVIMYCSKSNSRECLYFDQNNTLDQSKEGLFMPLIVTLFLVSMGIFFTSKNNKVTDKKKEKSKNGTSISHLYLLYITLFVFGMGVTLIEIHNAIKYFNIKNDNNVTTATIYSEIYNVGKKEGLYKPVAYYYVNNHKYTYVNQYYEKGKFDENIGKTFVLYYNKDNPNDVSKKENPVNFLLLFIGIGLSVLAFPFIFFKKKMEKRYDRIMEKRQNKEWKI